MRDIQMVLERWGAWAANNHEDVTWSSVAAGFKGLIPSKVKSRPQCCDDDAMIICGCMARLKKNNSDLHDLLGNDSNLLIVFYVQIMPDDFVMQLHRF